jgi:hypothetical protein
MAIEVTNFKLGIALPHTWNYIPIHFFDSFVQMLRPNFEYIRDYGGTGQIDVVRNNLVRKARIAGCSHILMMDTDQKFPVNTIPKLLSHRKEIVSALIYRRYPPFDPLMYKGEINSYEVIEDWNRGELVEVDSCGTGCILYEMSVFDNMPEPWFKFRENPKKEIGGTIGEDIGFCSDLRAKGYRIYVDTSLTCGHLSIMEVDEGMWQMWKFFEKNKTRKREGEKRR